MATCQNNLIPKTVDKFLFGTVAACSHPSPRFAGEGWRLPQRPCTASPAPDERKEVPYAAWPVTSVSQARRDPASMTPARWAIGRPLRKTITVGMPWMR